MIRVNRSADIPPSLAGDTSAGAIEAAKNAVHARNAAFDKMEFEAYKRQDVKTAINQLFHRKCAYCESDLRGQQPGDIEHFRPKGQVVIRNDDGSRSVLPGYFWLAASWENLLLSCADCNRPRTQDVVDGAMKVVGKANWFPISEETKRVRRPEDDVASEPRLLIDPCVDDPGQYLVFNLDGTIEARKLSAGHCPVGKATIDVCGLRRAELLQTRVARLKLLRNTLRHIRKALALHEEPDPDDLSNLEDFISPAGAFSAYCRAVTWSELGTLEPALARSALAGGAAETA